MDGLGFFQGPRRNRFDAFLGVEYYGIVDTSMTVEVVNRYLFGHGGSTRRSLGDPPENRQEVSLRITRNFMRERLEVTALAVLVAESEKPAAILRLDAEYELQDAVFLPGGILFFQEGNVPVLDTWGRNDRFFASIKWNF